jgi:uncharacterized protein with beta-barrel porin domain
MGFRRAGVRVLLASSSLAALLVGGGTPSALACYTGPFAHTNSGVTACITVNNTAFSGTLGNTGTISPGPTGIAVINGSTITGQIIDSGTISPSSRGIFIDATSKIISTQSAIYINGPIFSGGIANSGTLVGGATGNGINVDIVSTFSGGITNSGTISAGANGYGIDVLDVSIFSGFITNSGTIGSGQTGIRVSDVSTFTGTIANSGTITAGVALSGDSIFTGSILNSGEVGRISVDVSTFTGGITNGGMVSAFSAIKVSGGKTFSGNVVNSGTGLLSVATDGFGIVVSNSTFSASITNAGTISAGFFGHGFKIGIMVDNSTVLFGLNSAGGGIVNSGKITGASYGIVVGSTFSLRSALSSFAGGITNSGTIAAGQHGIMIGANFSLRAGFAGLTGTVTVSTFSGGIVNNGTIGAAAGNGVWVGGKVSLPFNSQDVATIAISSFSGGISNSGIISAGGNGIWVGGDATLLADDARNVVSVTVATFGGGISNSGAISAGGNGIWVGGNVLFSAVGSRNTASVTISTFSGSIGNSGTISAGGAGIEVGGSASGGGAVGNVASVTISTFVGGISNSGTIVAQTGIVVNSVSTFGGAIVNSGTITGTSGTAIDISAAPNGMTVDILGGAISGNIVGNGTGNGDTVNFALGSGSFAYADTLSGMQAVNINSGTLFDGGSISAAGVTVNSGGQLAPGLPNTTGSLTIAGNLSFGGGDYEIQLTPSAHASASVSSNLSISNGTVALSPLGLGAHYAATTFSILTYGGTLTGAFNPIVIYTGVLQLSAAPTISYVGNNVDLSYGNAYADLATPAGANQNQVNVINGINNAIFAGDTIPAGFQQLANLSGAAYLNALTRLDGEDATGAAASTFTLTDEFLELMLGQSGSGGGGGGGGLGFAPDQQTDALPPEIALAYDTILKAPAKQSFDQRWSAWGSGFGGTATFNGNAAVGSNNVNASIYGTAAGMEYRADPHTVFGFALAGGGLNWRLAQSLGTGRSDSFQAGVYARSYWGPAYVSAALAFGNNWLTTNRTALGDQLTASFTGQSYALRGEAGYRYALPFSGALIGVTPYGALQTQWFHTPTYREADLTGGGLGLSYNANTANDTRSELGARFDDLTAWNNKPLIFRARLGWAHDWESGAALNAAFESLPGSNFTLNGAPLPRDSALSSASAQYFFTPNWSLTAKFDGEFALAAQTYAGSGTLRYSW